MERAEAGEVKVRVCTSLGPLELESFLEGVDIRFIFWFRRPGSAFIVPEEGKGRQRLGHEIGAVQVSQVRDVGGLDRVRAPRMWMGR